MTSSSDLAGSASSAESRASVSRRVATVAGSERAASSRESAISRLRPSSSASAVTSSFSRERTSPRFRATSE